MPILSSTEILRLTDNLPQLSAAAVKIISFIDNPNTSREQIVELIKADAQILAECLKQSNSAAVASRRQYKNINEIVDALGFAHIKKVALFMSAKQMFSDPKIWFESVFTAVAAHYLALKAGYDSKEADSIYMAGLFNNYGSFVLKNSFPELFNCITDTRFKERIEKEKEAFGNSTTTIGSIILAHYGLPEYVTKILSKQSEVYTSDVKPENAFIELGRILSSIHNLNMEKLHLTLNLRVIREFVENAEIEKLDLTEESIERLNNQTKELVRS